MSHHELPHCLSETERCFRCCGNCRTKPKKPLGGFTIPLEKAHEEVPDESMLIPVSSSAVS